jgi:hypothetical protein
MKRWTNFLATVAVAGALALLPATARADGVNQFTGIPAFSGGVGPAVEGLANVNSFGISFYGDPLNRVYAFGTFSDGVNPAAAEIWEVKYSTDFLGSPVVILELWPQLGATTGPILISFTQGVSPAQDQLVNAINFELQRSDPSNIRRWYLLYLLRRCYR